MKNLKQYYKELGKLVYAVAAADGTIQQEERDILREMVVKELAAREKNVDSSGMNKAFYVDFEFDALEETQPALPALIQSFNHFVQRNAEPQDKDLLERSVRLLEKVAYAYTHQKEKDILDVVKEQLHPYLQHSSSEISHL